MVSDNYRQAFKAAIARIYHANGAVVGAGFLVTNRRLFTCAHVVEAALGMTIQDAPTDLIYLDFPLILPGQKIKAKVIYWSAQDSLDIAGLELESQPPDACHPVRLVCGDNLWNHPFQIFGFPSQRDFGVWAAGILQDRLANGWVQMEGIKVQGYPVQSGFSGAPVWDESLNGVVGMAVAAEKKQEEAKAAFMIPNSILGSAWADTQQWIEYQQPQSENLLNSVPSFHQVKLKVLQNHLAVLLAKYEAAYNQLNFTLNQADVISIKEQIKLIEQEIVEKEKEVIVLSV